MGEDGRCSPAAYGSPALALVLGCGSEGWRAVCAACGVCQKVETVTCGCGWNDGVRAWRQEVDLIVSVVVPDDIGDSGIGEGEEVGETIFFHDGGELLEGKGQVQTVVGVCADGVEI